MSLATFAAPFDDNNNNNINNKGTTPVHSNRVKNLLSKIHESFDNNDELSDFTPPPMPKSSGVEKTVERENFEGKQVPEYTQFYNTPVESYKPFYVSQTENTEQHSDINSKLNDILMLLKEQRDQKTENVTEELILYSFFGIFIIYLVDSFKRVGKYTR
jgi:hypothetical protein